MAFSTRSIRYPPRLRPRPGTTRPHRRAQAGSRLLASEASEHRRLAGGCGLEAAELSTAARKSRFYTAAIGSATESAAMLDVCLRRGLIATEVHDRGKQLLDRIVAMLVKLCRAMRDG
jgi:four helix bundle protein